MPKQKIRIRGPDQDQNPMESLQKLFNGFCNPKKGHPSDDDTVTDGTYMSEADLTSQVQAQRPADSTMKETNATPEPPCGNADEGVEVTLPDATKTRERQEEIKATYSTRRPRVTWGLGIVVVAIIAVFATLFTLHRLGYELADFTFTEVDSTKMNSKPSKPLIQIQYNEKKQTTPTPESKVTAPRNDRAQQKLDELLTLVAEIKDSEL